MWYNKLYAIKLCMRGELDMVMYQLFYGEHLIGVLEVNPENKQHKFTPNEEGVKEVKQITSLIPEMENGTNGFVEPIPFFQNRIMNMERNGLEEINYQTDWFVLKKV